MELYGTLHLGEKFQNFMELFNVSYGTEQLSHSQEVLSSRQYAGLLVRLYCRRYAVIVCKLKQNANEGCNSCASLAGLVLCFIARFIFTCDRSLRYP